MKHVLLGIFKKQEDADTAVLELGDAGFLTEEVSVIANEEKVKKYRSRENGGEAIAAGGILGGLAGLLIAATPVVLPGVGILVAGPLAMVTGLAFGTVTGGLLGALIDFGLSESQARNYERRIKGGEILVGVQVDDSTETKARDILEKHHAEELLLIPYTEKTKVAGRGTQEESYPAVGMKGEKTGKPNKKDQQR